ncbi:hypothetical protein QTP86_000430 [Hemibagrus guttatus]|nr:hypothetical protein QTP86_000430 [Hemibagrus guttatus]
MNGSSQGQCLWTGSGTVPLDWATGVVIPLFKKGDRRVCSNYRGITLLSLPGKVYSRVLERRVRPLVEPQIQEEQCGFRPSRGTLDQLYTLHRVLEGLWEFAQPVHMCFLDLEKAFKCVPRGILWEVLWEYGVRGPLLRAVRSLYNRSRSLVHIASCLDLQHALGCFVAECEAAGMRVSTSKSEAMVLDQKKVACTLQIGGEVLPQVEEFKYLGVLFTSEGRMDREIDRRIGAAAAVMRSMYQSVVVKKELSQKAKLSIGTSPWRGVPGMPHWEEAPGKTQDTLERLCLSAGLGMPRGPSGRAGGSVWGEGVQSNGECGKEVKKRVQAGWNGWRKVSGVLCDRKISARIKEKVYRTVVRPAMLYGLETMSLKKRQESELEVAELKMLRFSLGVTRLDKIRNKYIRGTAHVGRLGTKLGRPD